MIDEDISHKIKSLNTDISAWYLEGNSKTNNFAYNIILGMNYKLNNSCKAGLTYKWRDFGKTKSKNYKDVTPTTKVHYRGHSLSANLKYNF